MFQLNFYEMALFKNPPFKFVLLSGLGLGLLDLSVAFVDYAVTNRKNPLIILNAIASAVFGKEAFLEGNIMVFAGLIFHFCIAFLFTLFF